MATKINALQRSQIKSWLNEESYAAVFQLLQNKLESIKSEEISGQTEFETLRMLHKNQGRVEALINFFDEIDKSAYE